MSLTGINSNETTTPILQCGDLDASIEFYSTLGFAVVYKQAKPYMYLAVQWRSVNLHFGSPLQGIDPDREGLSCLIAVDTIEAYHTAFKASLKEWAGHVPTSGRPRLTRLRPGACRFTLVDPSGNNLIFVQRDEPAKLAYGGSTSLSGLTKILDNARILRDFKHDYRAAFRALDSALRRPKPDFEKLDRVSALAMMIELAPEIGQPDRIPALLASLQEISPTENEWSTMSDTFISPDRVRDLLAGVEPV